MLAAVPISMGGTRWPGCSHDCRRWHMTSHMTGAGAAHDPTHMTGALQCAQVRVQRLCRTQNLSRQYILPGLECAALWRVPRWVSGQEPELLHFVLCVAHQSVRSAGLWHPVQCGSLLVALSVTTFLQLSCPAELVPQGVGQQCSRTNCLACVRRQCLCCRAVPCGAVLCCAAAL